MANLFDPVVDGVQYATYHREPTRADIARGYGCTHYMDFPVSQVRKPDGRLKKWLVGPDWLRYYR